MTRRMNAKKISKSILALLITVPALLATNAMAQELKKPTLEDLIPGGETYHKPENKSYQWWGDAACLELGIDNIEGTWAVKGLGAKPGEKFTAISSARMLLLIFFAFILLVIVRVILLPSFPPLFFCFPGKTHPTLFCVLHRIHVFPSV